MTTQYSPVFAFAITCDASTQINLNDHLDPGNAVLNDFYETVYEEKYSHATTDEALSSHLLQQCIEHRATEEQRTAASHMMRANFEAVSHLYQSEEDALPDED